MCHATFAGGGADGRGSNEDVSVPKDIDLMALPQLCFPGISSVYVYSLLHYFC